MVFYCNINAFSNLTSVIYLYNENMNLEMTIKKLGSAYKFRVGRATGNEHIFFVWPHKLNPKKTTFFGPALPGGGVFRTLESATEIWDYISIQNLIFICVLGSKMATLASECPTYFDFSSAKLLTKFIFEFLGLFYIVAWISERVLIVNILFYLYKKGGDFFATKAQ